MISGKYEGMGYAKEAVEAILEYADEELEAPRVILRIDDANLPSWHFAEKWDFVYCRKDWRGSRMSVYMCTTCE